MRIFRTLAFCTLLGRTAPAQHVVVNEGIAHGPAGGESVALGWTKSPGFVADHFAFGARGEVWVIDSIRIWAEIPENARPEDLYERVVLFGGIETPPPDPSQPPQPECECHNLQAIRSAALSQERRGNIRQFAMSRSGPGLWQVDFGELRWSVPGGAPIQYGVIAVARPGKGAPWLMRASKTSGNHRLRLFDEKGKEVGIFAAPDASDSAVGFDIEVQAHKTAPVTIRQVGDMFEVIVHGGPMFDTGKIDISSLKFGPGRASAAANRQADENGSPALIATFPRGAAGVRQGALNACLNGLQNDGIPFEGCDLVSQH